MPTISRQELYIPENTRIIIPEQYRKRLIFHADINYYYANLVEMMEPWLKTKPLIVHGDQSERHGIVLTANPISKLFGIRVGMAIWQAKQLCKDLVCRQVDFKMIDLYTKLIREVYDQFTDRRQDFGLDEAWLDFTGIAKNLDEAQRIAQHIMYLVKQMFGITISIGISFNRILAKLGSDYKPKGQRVKTPNTLTVMGPDNWQQIVFPMDVGELLFIGPNRTKALNEMGIFTIGDLACADESILRGRFGVVGTAMWGNANGLDISSVSEPNAEKEPEKSVSNSFTAYRDLTTPEDVWLMTLLLSESVGERMRELGVVGNTVECHWRYADDLHSDGHQNKLEYSTNCDMDIAREAFAIYTRWTHTFRPLRKITVRVTGLSPADIPQQISFEFDAEKLAKRESLNKTKDKVRKKYGRDSLGPAVFMTDPQLAGMRHAPTYGKKMFFDY